jgi:hypothetical protein
MGQPLCGGIDSRGGGPHPDRGMEDFNGGGEIGWQALMLAAVSLIALLRNAPAPLVLLAAALQGYFYSDEHTHPALKKQ